MKLFRIKIENYRSLKNFTLDLEDDLSLVIGKNNSGKTSILSILDRFLNHSEKLRFSFDDLNVAFKSELAKMIEDANPRQKDSFGLIGVKLKMFVEYGDEDDLSNLSRLMMDLDPDNNVSVLCFEYALDFEGYTKLRDGYTAFSVKEGGKADAGARAKRTVFDFLRSNYGEHFQLFKKSLEFDKKTGKESDGKFIDLVKEGVQTKDLVNFKYISAGRGLNSSDTPKILSGQTSRIYERTETSEQETEVVERFKDRLSDADANLSAIYGDLFKNTIEKVRNFGGIRLNETEIEIISNLQHREILAGNTTVVYKHSGDQRLPETHNGLGYMNLISMIFEIEILMEDFRRTKTVKPADINLLFIEEPEAHTHPQMQYVFIKNIKRLLAPGIKREDGENRPLQCIITTHSSHIVADCEFDDIKYLQKEDHSSVVAKNLKDLKHEYAQRKEYEFLKQYLTVSRAEIFFADKAIMIEGDTERILIPTVMKKIDAEEAAKYRTAGGLDPMLPLLSQNISVIEVGAYAQIFEKFIDFLGIKALIVTDLDATNATGEACRVADGVGFSNGALKFFFGSQETLGNLNNYDLVSKTFSKTGGTWAKKADGRVCVAYQTEEEGYRARSFEDGFIHINKTFLSGKRNEFRGLQNRDFFDESANDAYTLAGRCVLKKTHFALDILFHSTKQLDNWKVPSYIKEGLLWLKKD